MTRMLAVVLVVLVLLAGSTPGRAAPVGSTVTIGLETSISTFDCWFTTETLCLILSKLWGDTLFEIDPKDPSRLRPELATSWKYTSPTVLEVKLRQGVKFHNGEPFNARAVKTTLEFMADPQNNANLRYGVAWLQRVEVVDDHTVRLIYSAPNAPSLQRLAQLGTIYPPEYYMQVKTQGFGPRPVGTGPYRVVSWSRDQQAVFEANPDYFGGAKGKPAVQRIIVRFLPELGTRVAELLSGGVDVITEVAPDQIPAIKASGRATIVPMPTNQMVFVNLDGLGRAGPGPFQNLQVRQAAVYAIDKDAIVRRVLGGYATRLDAMATPYMFGYTDQVPKYPYNPTKARQLLSEAGYPNGFDTEYVSWVPQGQAIEAVVGYLRAVGIRAALRYFPNDVASASRLVASGKAPMSSDLWTTIFDADAVLSPYFLPGAPRSYNNDPQLTAWLQTAAASINQAQRRELYSRILRRIAENAYMIPLYSPQSVFAARNDIDFSGVVSPFFPRYYAIRRK